jgi:hypothetical protein
VTRARRKLNATGAMAKRPPAHPKTPVRPDQFRIRSVVWTMLTVPHVTRLGAQDVGGAVREISVRTEIIPVRMLDRRVAKPRMAVRRATTITTEFVNFAPTMESVWTRRRVCVPIRPTARAAMWSQAWGVTGVWIYRAVNSAQPPDRVRPIVATRSTLTTRQRGSAPTRFCSTASR